jgi:hypothetical protein
MANSVIAGVLTSLFSGSQGRGADPDYKPVMGSMGTQHLQQQAAAQAASDAASENKLKVVKSNLETLTSQLTAAKLGDAAMDKQIADGKSVYDLAKQYDETLGTKPDERSIQKDGVSYQEAMQSIGDGKLGLIAVPSGRSSHLDPQTGKVVNDVTYSVLNPHVKVSLDEDDVKMMAATNPSWADAWKQHGGEPIEIPLNVVNAERLVRNKVNNVQNAIDTLTSDKDTADAIGFDSSKAQTLMTLAQSRQYREAIQNTESQLAAHANSDRHYSMLDAMLTTPGGVELAQKLGINPTKANAWLDKEHDARLTADAQAKKSADLEQKQAESDISLDKEKKLAQFKKSIGADNSDAVSNTKSYTNEWVNPKTGVHYDLSSPVMNMVEGNQDPSQLTKRGKNYDANLKLANDYSFARYGKPFDAAQAQEDYKYANAKSTQDTIKMLQSLTGDDNKNTSGTLAQLQTQLDALGNTRVPRYNELANWVDKNAGNPAVTDFNATLLGVSDEMGKILGGGVATDSSRKEARDIIDKSFSGQQGHGAIASIRGSMANRQNAMVGKNVYLSKQYSKMDNPMSQQHDVPVGAFKGYDAQGNLVGYKTADGKVVRF